MKNVQLVHSEHRPTAVRLPLCLLVPDIDDPLNVGTLFRIADALGIEHLHLAGSTPVPPNPSIRKTARSAERHVPFSHVADPLEAIAALRAAGYRIVCLELTSASVDIRRFELVPGDRVCLVLGSENVGVRQELLDAADATVHIPMLGQNSSMNVGNACAIAAFEILRKVMPCQSKTT